MLGMSDFVDSLINQRRSQFQRSSRASTGTLHSTSLHGTLWLSLFGVPERCGTRKGSRADFRPSSPPQLLQQPSTPTPLPPPLSTLTLLAVLHCTILSQQAVQYLRAGEGSTANLSTPGTHQVITAHTPHPKALGKPLVGTEHVTCLVCPFSGTNAGGNPSEFLHRMYLSSKRNLRSFGEADL